MLVGLKAFIVAGSAVLVFAAGLSVGPAAHAKQASERPTVEFMARKHFRIRSYNAEPDARFFGWGYGPSIAWYLSNGYPGPYFYYWDENCPVRSEVVVTRRGRQVIKRVRACY